MSDGNLHGKFSMSELPADMPRSLRDVLEAIIYELDLRAGNVPKATEHRYVQADDIAPLSFTLKPNVALTTLTDGRITESSIVLLMPTTSNAAAALATTYFTQRRPGKCTVNHANNASTDKTFAYVVLG